jgi:hypothetical protein
MCFISLRAKSADRLIIRIKAAFTQALLQKTLKIRFSNDSKNETGSADTGKEQSKVSEAGQSKVGMIMNLCSTDLQQVADARYSPLPRSYKVPS